MIKIYIDPNGNQVPKPSYLNYNGTCYVPPTDEQLEAAGWEIREEIEPIPEPYLPTIEELVEQRLRERYSINQEFEVQRKRETDPQVFQAYYDYVEECIAWANEQDHRDNE